METHICPRCGERYPFFTKEMHQKATCRVCSTHMIAPTSRASNLYLACHTTFGRVRAEEMQIQKRV